MTDDVITQIPHGVFRPRAKGLQHSGLRQANMGAVINIVGFNPGLSNAEIARSTGLAPQTVSAILTALEKDGLIQRGAALRGRRGQPAVPIFLRAEGAYAYGIEINWRHAEIVIIDFNARIIAQERLHYAYPDPRTVFDEIAEVALRLRQRLPEPGCERLCDIGLAMPGRIVEGLERGGAPPEVVTLWSALSPERELQRRLGLPVRLYNDGNAACWGEFIGHKRPRPDSFIYLMVSTYVAAGIVSGGRVWGGASGQAADLAAMLVDVDGGTPRTGHTIASLTALEKRLQAAGFEVTLVDHESCDKAAMQGEITAWCRDAARALALVIFNTLRVVETDMVIIDTIAPKLADQLVTHLERELDRLQTTATPRPRVQRGQLGQLGPAVGAAELSLYQRFFAITGAD